MSTEAMTEAAQRGRRATAESMAAKQRDISVSEFFTKNRHLLGFDNPQKALLTAVKEAVDNSLDACEEAGILPSIRVQIEELAEGRFRVTVEDNGPGIVKAQIPKIFAKLLYGSKFHRLKQSRGQQGIGISAAGMYGQLTTGRPITIISKTGKGRPAYRMEVRIDARSNAPEVLKDEVVPWDKEHGTLVAIEMAGLYRAGRASVSAYIEQTVVANPHLEMTFQPPRGEPLYFPRASEELPPETQEIKPHPYGVELGMLIKYFQESGERSAREVLMEDFSRVTQPVANELLRKAGVDPSARASRIDGPHIEAIHQVIQVSQASLPPLGRLSKALLKREDKFSAALLDLGSNFTSPLIERVARNAGFEPTLPARSVTLAQLEAFQAELEKLQVRILPPPATCVAPIGEALIIEGLKRRFKAEFYASHTRPPAVYRGNPFVVEVGIAYGGELAKDESCELLRFANRVPLLYQPRACATTEAVVRVNWKSYAKDGGINQRGAELPVGPLAVLVHMASVWVPFTNEAKEAIASYDEIVEEIRAALMECGRKLGTYVNAQQAERWQRERKSLFERYIEEIATSIHRLTGVPRERVRSDFHNALPNFVKLNAPPSSPPPASEGSMPPPSEALLSERPSEPPRAASEAPPVMDEPRPMGPGSDRGTTSAPNAGEGAGRATTRRTSKSTQPTAPSASLAAPRLPTIDVSAGAQVPSKKPASAKAAAQSLEAPMSRMAKEGFSRASRAKASAAINDLPVRAMKAHGESQTAARRTPAPRKDDTRAADKRTSAAPATRSAKPVRGPVTTKKRAPVPIAKPLASKKGTRR